jgi:hypothetical protein
VTDGAAAAAIVDANSYMVIGTADAQGTPWVSPVWFAHEAYREFFWISKPEARHSRNIEARAEVSIVIFDSTVPPGHGQAVYMPALAGQVEDEALERGIRVYTRREEAEGIEPLTREDVTAPARHRLYLATASEHFILGPHDERLPVSP